MKGLKVEQGTMAEKKIFVGRNLEQIQTPKVVICILPTRVRGNYKNVEREREVARLAETLSQYRCKYIRINE